MCKTYSAVSRKFLSSNMRFLATLHNTNKKYSHFSLKKLSSFIDKLKILVNVSYLKSSRLFAKTKNIGLNRTYLLKSSCLFYLQYPGNFFHLKSHFLQHSRNRFLEKKTEKKSEKTSEKTSGKTSGKNS